MTVENVNVEVSRVVYQSYSLNLPEPMSVEEARHHLKELFPEIANAEYDVVDGVCTFTIRAGEKGN
jgi:hypothetical protein